LAAHHGSGGNRDDDGRAGLLIEARSRQCDRRIGNAHRTDDFLVVDQFLRDLDSTFRLGFVIAFDKLDLAATDAALGVDFGRRKLHAIANGHAQRSRSTRERADKADLQRVLR
jgi:hypothetical protein